MKGRAVSETLVTRRARWYRVHADIAMLCSPQVDAVGSDERVELIKELEDESVHNVGVHVSSAHTVPCF